MGGRRAIPRLAAGFLPPSHHSRPFTADLRCRGYLDRPFGGRLQLSRLASRRSQPRELPRKRERSRGAPGLALLPVRPYGGTHASPTIRRESGISPDARFAKAAAQRLGRGLVTIVYLCPYLYPCLYLVCTSVSICTSVCSCMCP